MGDGFFMPYKDPEQAKAYQLAYQLAYRATHLEEAKAYQLAYCATHREEANARIAAYYAAHPEANQIRQARRRARKSLLPVTLTTEQWRVIKQAYRQRCAYCGEKPKRLTQDHVIPLSKNGGTIRRVSLDIMLPFW